MALVDYDSSSSDADDADTVTHSPLAGPSKSTGPSTSAPPIKSVLIGSPGASSRPTKRPRKLPSLPSSFDSGPKYDPSLHQGRKRTRPYVDGDHYAHVYISLVIPPSLKTALVEYVGSLQLLTPSHTIHTQLDHLHISLTHPLPLRRHQISPFIDKLSTDLRAGHRSRSADQGKGFRISLAGGVKVYHNRTHNENRSVGRTKDGKPTDDRGRNGGVPEVDVDESESESTSGDGGSGGSRAFLALRVGAGASELERLLDSIIHPILRVIHLPTYHENPEFHTSFAWCLLKPNSLLPQTARQIRAEHRPETSLGADVPGSKTETPSSLLNKIATGLADEATSNSTSMTISSTPRKSPFTDSMIEELNTRFEQRILACQPASGWEVDTVHVKIGKDVKIIALS